MGRPTLDALAVHYGTDKSSRRHRFTDVYERHLEERRNEPVVVLEIGVYKGASLRMWRDYFPRGRILGLDINEGARAHEDQRIQICIGDQGNPDILRDVAAYGPFDLIVDDGGHRAEQQLVSLQHLWPHVKPRGVYVIEDIHTSYLARWGMGWRHEGTTVEFLKGVVDDIHARHHDQPASLPRVESVHFHHEMCILRRLGA